LERGEKF
jgi:L-rhamnose mutarotase